MKIPVEKKYKIKIHYKEGEGVGKEILARARRYAFQRVSEKINRKEHKTK